MTEVKKVPLTQRLDDFFEKLLTATETSVAGKEVSLEQKIEIFKEGIRWAAVKNKLPDPEAAPDPGKTGRLAGIKNGLKK